MTIDEYFKTTFPEPTFSENLQRVREGLKRIARKTGRSRLSVALNFAWLVLRFRAQFSEFEILPLYDFSDRMIRDNCLTYHRALQLNRALCRTATPEDAAIFDEKNLFSAHFRDFVRRDWVFVPDSTREEVLAFIARNEKFLAKASISTMGKNIYQYYSADLDPDAFYREYEGRPFMLETFITQHPALSAINPTSVNTVRMVTACSHGRVAVVGCCLRCGVDGAYVDNIHSGGVAWPVDIESGIVTGPGKNSLCEQFLRHPTTQFVLPGFQIPFWEQITDMVHQAALRLPQIGYVGWDVAVTPEGPELIEGNVNIPDITLMQLDYPNAYARIRQFLRDAESAE